MIYYLEGIEKKGPFSKQELKDLNLNTETLVYSDEWKSWQKIKELPDLLIFLSSKDFEKKEISRKSYIKENPIIIKPIFVYFILLLTSLLLSFISVSIRKKSDFTDIKNEINDYFGGNQSIADFDMAGIDGVFRKLSRQPFFNNIFTDEIGFKKEEQVYDKNGNNPKNITFFKSVANAKKIRRLE